jgi:hypothetical protein
VTTSRAERAPRILARSVRVASESFTVDLSDGRALSVPFTWYPRLEHGRAEERTNWELIGDGDGIHWPDLDEDISVDGLLAGQRSGESERSFRAWLDERKPGGSRGR